MRSPPVSFKRLLGSVTSAQVVVVRMRADPEPNDLVPCPHGERPIGEADACREDGSGRMNLLESEAGMGGVAAEQVVGKTGLGLNLRRQGSEGLAKPLRRMRGQC